MTQSAQPLIVVAEDNAGDAFLIREALQEQQISFKLELVDNGESMLSLINDINSNHTRDCPDLILLDLHLPKRSGEDVLEHLRSSSRCSDIPVIVMTSSDYKQHRERTAVLGISAFFRKPSDLEGFMEIGALVRQVLNRDHSNCN